MASPVTEVAPHGVVEEPVFASLNGSGCAGCDLARHYGVEPASADQAGFKGVHVEVPEKDGPPVTGVIFIGGYLGRQFRALEGLTVAGPVQLAGEVRNREQYFGAGRHGQATD